MYRIGLNDFVTEGSNTLPVNLPHRTSNDAIVHLEHPEASVTQPFDTNIGRVSTLLGADTPGHFSVMVIHCLSTRTWGPQDMGRVLDKVRKLTSPSGLSNLS